MPPTTEAEFSIVLELATEEEIASLSEEVQSFTVRSQADYEKGAEWLKRLGRLSTNVDDTYEKPRIEANREWKRIVAELKKRKGPIEAARNLVREKMGRFLDAEEKREAKKREKAIQRDAPPPAKPKRTTARGTSSGKRHEYTMVDPSKVKPEFLVPDELKIGKIVRSLGQDAEAVVGVGSIKVTSKNVVAGARR